MRFRIVSFIAAVMVVFGLTACDPDQQESSTIVLGDSITLTPLLSGMQDQIPDVEQYVSGLGWHAATPQIIQGLEDAIEAGEADEVVVALGTNDTNVGTIFGVTYPGWDQADETAWTSLLDRTPAPDANNDGDTDGTCFSIILPWITQNASGTMPQARFDEQDEARAFMVNLQTQYPNQVRITDWRTYIDPDGDRIPDWEIINDDGIHFRDDNVPGDWNLNPPAVAARAAAVNEAVGKCSDMVNVPPTTVPETTTTTAIESTTTTSVPPTTIPPTTTSTTVPEETTPTTEVPPTTSTTMVDTSSTTVP